MSIYLDTSALARLIVVERESNALRAWIEARSGTALVTNSVGIVELQRLTARVSREAYSAAVLLSARVDVLDLTSGSLALAAQLPPPEVRTLDALHIASAALLADLDSLVTYDDRMARAARDYGLPVDAPAG